MAGVPQQGTAIIGVDDAWCRKIADRLEQSSKRVVRVSVRRQLRDGIYAAEQRIVRAGATETSAVAELGGIGSLRGLHNAQNAACAAAAALALGLDAGSDPGRAAVLSGARTPHGGSRPARRRPLRQRLQGHQCGFGGAGARLFRRHFLDRGRQAEDRRHRIAAIVLSAHPQGLSRSAKRRKNSPRRSAAACRTRSTARSTRPWRRQAATPRRAAPRNPSCCCRRPAPRSTSTAISRSAAPRSGTWSGAAGRDAEGVTAILIAWKPRRCHD